MFGGGARTCALLALTVLTGHACNLSGAGGMIRGLPVDTLYPNVHLRDRTGGLSKRERRKHVDPATGSVKPHA